MHDCANTGPRSLCILGSTGSIGTQALELVRLFPDRLRVAALTAHRSTDTLIRQALEFLPECVALADPSGLPLLRAALHGRGTRILAGEEGICEAAAAPRSDVVVAAISGIAGLAPVLAALQSGKMVALANKETLVAAGAHAVRAAKEHGGMLIPVDSEHSAIFQCLAGEKRASVDKIILTASGGPFRTREAATLAQITPAEALRHPNWSMGAKVTIDSATMMNKGLEVIEAHWLFSLAHDRIEVVVHPQSIVHSMVVFRDGSAKAQLGLPDMRLPILYAFSYPERWSMSYGRVDWASALKLEFTPPDLQKFPCLGLAFEALRMGGSAPAVLNAANEEAVALFLSGRLSYLDIPRAVESSLAHLASASDPDLEEVFALDRAARRHVLELGYVQTI